MALVTIVNHTTASKPHPHILYTVQVTLDGTYSIVHRRYSEFITLHTTLQDTFKLPPKRLLVTSFLPSAWVDDALIAERKAGLSKYLQEVLTVPEFKGHVALKQFIMPGLETVERSLRFEVEDALPSTLSRAAAFNLLSRALPKRLTVKAAKPLSGSYYPDWSSGNFPPEKVNFALFDIIFFAFALPSASSTLDWSTWSQDILRRLISSARNSGKGTKIVLSVGGWGGSKYFSNAASSAANRTKFVNALASAVSTFGLAGVDLDWEYPNSPGAGNNYSSKDAQNLLSLLTSLRATLGTSKIISMAVPHLPWLGADGRPLADVSAYAKVMDYINIMNYDVWGASSTPGPNAPLGNLCGTSKQPQASAQAAVAQWKKAGFPASKMMLGMANYGWVSQSTKTKLTGGFMPDESDKVDEPTNTPHPRSATEVKATIADLRSWYGQQIPFATIVQSGALVKKSDGNYGQGGGFTMGWDDCSDTPFLFNVSQATVVSYDDTYSVKDKAIFAKQAGLAGCFTWSMDQDGAGYPLQNSIRSGMGI